MPDADVSAEIIPTSDEDRAPAAHHLMDEDRLRDEDLFADEKLPTDVKFVLWSFIFVLLLACTIFAISSQDFIHTRANVAPSGPTQPAIGTATADSLPPLSSAPPTLVGAQANGVTPSVENAAPLIHTPPPAVAEAAAPVPSPASAVATPHETVLATAPAVYPSVLTLAPKQIVSPPPRHIHKVTRREAGNLCPIELANEMRPGCNTFASKEITIR